MSTVDNKGFIHDTDGVIVEKTGTTIAIIGGVGVLAVGIGGLFGIGVLRGRTLGNAIAVPISLIGTGVGLTGIGRIMQSNKLKDKLDTSGRVILGASLVTMSVTFILANEPRNYQNVFGVGSLIGLAGGGMIATTHLTQQYWRNTD
jgi:hypothetical protein